MLEAKPSRKCRPERNRRLQTQLYLGSSSNRCSGRISVRRAPCARPHISLRQGCCACARSPRPRAPAPPSPLLVPVPPPTSPPIIFLPQTQSASEPRLCLPKPAGSGVRTQTPAALQRGGRKATDRWPQPRPESGSPAGRPAMRRRSGRKAAPP